MASFHCRSRDSEGRLLTERIDAPSAMDAAEHLERRGLLPIAIERLQAPPEAPAAMTQASAPLFVRRPPAREMVLATRQLATLVRAGVVIHNALDTVAAECENQTLKSALVQVTQDVLRGSSLSKALGKHPHIFDTPFINAVEAGQLSGKLDLVLTRLASTTEVSLKRRNAVKSALRYPVIVLVTFAAAFFFLLRFVVPKFMGLFGSYGADLPLPTRMMLACHEAVSTYAPLTLLSLFGLVALVVVSYRTAPGRRFWDRVKLLLPAMGPLQLKSAISSFLQTFNTLNESGVPILHNLEISAQAMGNKVLESDILEARKGVERGEPLSKQLREHRRIPPLVSQMFAVGEKSGRMSEILEPLISHYDAEVQQAVEGLTAAIEPMITVLMGGLILFLALGIFLPMWGFLKVVQEKP